MRRESLLRAAIICLLLAGAILVAYLSGDAMSVQQENLQGKYQEEYRVINHDR